MDNRKVVKALPDNAPVVVRLSGRKRSLIWDALYGRRASGQYSDKPRDALLVEQIMASMRIIDQRHPVLSPEDAYERGRKERMQRMERR